MTRAEAFQLLGVNPSATTDQLKQAWRQRAAKLHPDINKAEDAEARFKELNEAYQKVQEPGSPDVFEMQVQFFVDDLFTGSFRPTRNRKVEVGPTNFYRQMELAIGEALHLSFEESVLGCQKDSRVQFMFQQGDRRPREEEVVVEVPAGVKDEETFTAHVQLGGMRRRALFKTFVDPDPDMKLDGNDVISSVEITLLEALKGASKKVRTVKGEKTLKIKPGVKNRDFQKVTGYGVPPRGNHLFVIHVAYPESTDKLIEFLEQGCSSAPSKPRGE
jgi:DnaJ-class molecular chaperone